MELPGSNYLLAIATIAISFVSFSTIVVVFRQSLGAGLSEFHILLVRFFIESGLIAVFFSLVPLLLGLLGLQPSFVWRLSSLAFALFSLFYLIIYLRRRSRVQRGRPPLRIYIINGITIVVILGLFLSAMGIGIEPSAGPYALAATWVLAQAVIVFIQTLPIFFQPPQKD